MIVEGSGDDIKLLFSGKRDELDGITGNTDREVGVFRLLRMIHGIEKLLFAEDVDVEMMCTLIKVAIENLDKVVDSFGVGVTKSVRIHGLSVGDAIEGELIWKLGNRVEGGKQARVFCTGWHQEKAAFRQGVHPVRHRWLFHRRRWK